MVMPHVDGSFVALVRITTRVILTRSDPNQTVTYTLPGSIYSLASFQVAQPAVGNEGEDTP
jgi:hypothetical protein